MSKSQETAGWTLRINCAAWALGLVATATWGAAPKCDAPPALVAALNKAHWIGDADDSGESKH